MIDITPSQQNLVLQLLRQRLPLAGAVAFGSRVKGWPFGRGAKPYSDLDIALRGLQPTDDLALAHLRADLEESSLPWRVDLSRWQDLPQPLQTLITQHGISLRTQTVPETQTTPT